MQIQNEREREREVMACVRREQRAPQKETLACRLRLLIKIIIVVVGK